MNTNTSGVIKGGSLAATRHQSGFTLIELVIVLAVLGALAAIAVPQLTGLQEDARLAGIATTVSSQANNEFARDLLDGDTGNWSSGVCTYVDTTVVSASVLDGFSLTNSDNGSAVSVTIPTYTSTASGDDEVTSTECFLNK